MTEIAAPSVGRLVTPARTLLWGTLVAALVLGALISVALGRYAVPIETVAAILWSQIVPAEPTWSVAQETVVLLVRVPRVLLAIVVGAGLAASGAALQGIFRNPLVGPQIVGVSSGAAFGGALAILLGVSSLGLVANAIVFALVALLAVGLMCRVDGRSPVLMLVLAGLVVSAFFAALVSLLIYVADPETKMPGIVFWLMGSLATASYPKLMIAAVGVGAGGVVLMRLRWRINLLSLGDEEARALGVRVELTRWLLLGAVCTIVAAQVSVSGVIGWVGLVVPHLARLLVGSDHRVLLPASALLGAIYMLVIDDLARSLTPGEIPLGILTAIVGAPLFALLLRRRHGRVWAHD